MNKIVMASLFAAGLAVVAWVGWGFVGSSSLALVMTVVIGGVYVLGAYELVQFRAATASLTTALAVNPAEPLADLDGWLVRLVPSLRSPVRQRIEGERVALPGPALTPYLVGLLVMLGMLGTFLGMVITFKGAMFALETSSSLESIRSALAAPIQGLGLSFGTSIAGVAASAILGLLSAMSRRERLEAARLLDARVPALFRPFSAAHRRDEMLLAFKTQAQAMPLIAERLQDLMQGLERRNDQLNQHLLAQQQEFHREAASAYTHLASSVGASLQESLETNALRAGDAIRQVVEQAMAAMTQEAQHSHERLRETTDVQLQALTAQWEGTAHRVADTWTTALHSYTRTQGGLVEQLGGALQSVTKAFDERSNFLVASLRELGVQSHATQLAFDQQRLDGWIRSMETMASALSAEWQRAGAQTAAQQQGVCQALEATTAQITERMTEQVTRAIGGAAALMDQSDALLRTRIETEAQWVHTQGQRMDELTAVWRTELNSLRDAEAVRGQAAVDRLDTLQAAVAQHLAMLGSALEAPLTRLLKTAADVPQAAAVVITQLREEMTRLSERDNVALVERTAMMEQLGTLLNSVSEAAIQQRAAVETLAGSAVQALEQAGQQFGRVLREQAGTVGDVAVHVAASAVELASLGESFSRGVDLFSGSNEKLMESMQSIEQAIGQSMSRSDEQLAYYVAQAREVIDLSISAQQGIVEDLRRLHGNEGSVGRPAMASLGGDA